MKYDYIPVDSTDELDVAGGREADRVRMVGEYRPSNMPLSRFEMEMRAGLGGRSRPGEWVPRTMENIGELTPLPEEV
ncbi:MAG TPA: hypothetical protein VMH05_13465 [Bryobacteraceae bacterium]|nr:hypothetical protein [Bryobacteraceae bacterium]